VIIWHACPACQLVPSSGTPRTTHASKSMSEKDPEEIESLRARHLLLPRQNDHSVLTALHLVAFEAVV
jgi:hypothetical protein